MALVVTRIDERLVHGQVAYSWSVAYQVDEIIVVDNLAASDEMQKMLLSMAVPAQLSHQILTEYQAVSVLKQVESSQKRVFLVLRHPNTLLSLLENGVQIKEVNIGGMYHKPDRRQITKTVYVNDEEEAVIKKIKEFGVDVEVRTAPSDKSSRPF
ncbi:PTS system mannose/fructose/N-acetylgalactosamine-transporter subunit IIB [Camelliibacillus cellulosilyticus]|uniref:PTS system mannose/fructose/N-acetylgalactosamine-transporter subunit IIB n=1 Tax=Camelliibacillus cellulosilyticus TaxID=2174486 RepID=A0ABV9GQM0_9BACL